MNFDLPQIPKREAKPRNIGLTMVMDKGLSIGETENFVESNADFVDIVKLGFGTSLLTKHLKEKLAIYKQANIKTYFGGTLFEAFIVRNMYDEYRRYLDTYQMELLEVSDGMITLAEDEKCNYISNLAKDYTVLSEVGCKMDDRDLCSETWISCIKAEYQAGSWKVITEARESGTVGIYNKDGSADQYLIKEIAAAVKPENIIWEAPCKSQQTWFVKLLGPEVNLGNIAPCEAIPLETLRLGLRGDTVLDFLD